MCNNNHGRKFSQRNRQTGAQNCDICDENDTENEAHFTQVCEEWWNQFKHSTYMFFDCLVKSKLSK